ncbi:MAG: hypothetical protein LBU86_04395 [Oscillospiraceae bacterium]|jgi:hypothetical protein|nr:hypothetical protein [Oscillospiraceae bacterium]
MRKLSVFAICALFVCLFSFSAYSQDVSYPDLPPEEIAHLSPEIEFFIDVTNNPDLLKVYDGQTGKFLFALDRGENESQIESLQRIRLEARRLGIN